MGKYIFINSGRNFSVCLFLFSSIVSFSTFATPLLKTSKYVTCAFGGEFAIHNYNFFDIGPTPGNPKKIGNSNNMANTDIANVVNHLGFGFTHELPNNFYIGACFDIGLGNNKVHYQKGAYKYKDVLTVTPSGRVLDKFLTQRPTFYKIEKNFSLGPSIDFGRELQGRRFYVRLGAVVTKFLFSFQTGDASYALSDYKGIVKYQYFVVPAIGAEFKIAANVWLGGRLSMPIGLQDISVGKRIVNSHNQNEEFLNSIRGKSNFISAVVTMKYEF